MGGGEGGDIELGRKGQLFIRNLVILMAFDMSDWKGWQKGALVVDLLNEIPVSGEGGRRIAGLVLLARANAGNKTKIIRV